MSSPLGTQLSLLRVQVDEGFQLVLRGGAALLREHRHHTDKPPMGALKAFRFYLLNIIFRFF